MKIKSTMPSFTKTSEYQLTVEELIINLKNEPEFVQWLVGIRDWPPGGKLPELAGSSFIIYLLDYLFGKF